MAMNAVSGPAGPPWEPALAGALDEHVVESELLTSNPLGDPSRRPLYVYRPPGLLGSQATRVPAVYVLQGYTGQLDMWKARAAFEPTVIERIDALFTAGMCPDAIVVFVDAWTSLGGSQFLNSTSTGPYMDYICDEVVGFVDGRYPTLASRQHRGVAGKSSGGYGAMVLSMLRPDVFGAFASHAGDALFEQCYVRDFGAVARSLRENFNGSVKAFRRELAAADHFDFDRYGTILSTYAYAAAYTPDPDHPGEALLPFELDSGRLIPELWERWLQRDPVRMAPGCAEALRSMRRIYLDAGRRDEWFLDLGAQAFANELSRLGVEYTLELFDGRHGGISHRYPRAVKELVQALADVRETRAA